MSALHIREDDGEWHVWISLDDEPWDGASSFIIGIGATRDEAVAAAVRDLEAAVDQLQQPAEA